MILTHDGNSYECFAEFWEDLVEEEDVIDGEMKVGNFPLSRL